MIGHLGMFPHTRLRRMRRTDALRRLVCETSLSVNDLVMPYFVVPGRGRREPVAAMPGVARLSVDELLREADQISSIGIPAILLFGIPQRKNASGSEAWSERGAVQTAVREIKRRGHEFAVITDVCLCEYTSHGHCGILKGGEVDNDATLSLLARAAVSHARAGADMVAPSDMMDGRVGAIRKAMDRAGYRQVGILSYAAKYASAFYGPFREAAQSTPQSGDRRGYQMDPGNAAEALREIELDLAEGADVVMIKPALAYLDVIRLARERFSIPIAAYNVSGEYGMVKAAAGKGWLEERRAAFEILVAIKRAGASFILSYHAKEVAQSLRVR
jgi:porphobilinogen synthase